MKNLSSDMVNITLVISIKIRLLGICSCVVKIGIYLDCYKTTNENLNVLLTKIRLDPLNLFYHVSEDKNYDLCISVSLRSRLALSGIE